MKTRGSGLALRLSRIGRASGSAGNTRIKKMSSGMQYGTDRMQQLQELKRELKQREQVFPRWVSQGRLKQSDATHRLNCLRAVIDDFEQRHKPTAAQGSFGI